ncbi:MAG: hypothetical protein Q8S03_12780 [Brevundimonas sp.]|nr:hypothetical protein [Brevundimonas sp.]MDP3405562.1 hypothetical protein [Brevundimonas sp.]
MARAIIFTVSNRLQPVAAALLCLMAAQLVLASCGDPEPIPYMARTTVVR